MIYCDSSFLVALYLERDSFHQRANQAAHSFREPILYTLLAELELENGVRRSLGAKNISVAEQDTILRQIAEDESQGILIRRSIPQADHFTKARELSKRYTSRLSVRSLDILHVAAALLLNASAFASFDLRQRKLAAAVGLRIIPGQLVNPR